MWGLGEDAEKYLGEEHECLCTCRANSRQGPLVPTNTPWLPCNSPVGTLLWPRLLEKSLDLSVKGRQVNKSSPGCTENQPVQSLFGYMQIFSLCAPLVENRQLGQQEKKEQSRYMSSNTTNVSVFLLGPWQREVEAEECKGYSQGSHSQKNQILCLFFSFSRQGRLSLFLMLVLKYQAYLNKSPSSPLVAARCVVARAQQAPREPGLSSDSPGSTREGEGMQ